MKNKIQFVILPKSTGRGMLSIYVKATQHGRSVCIDTSVRIFKDEWDDSDGAVINNPNSKSLNKYIRQTVYDLETMEFDSDGKISLTTLKRSYENREVSFDFYQMVEKTIPTRDIRESTKRLHFDWLRKIKKYRDFCPICELTEEWVQSYYQWMKNLGRELPLS